MTFSYAERGLYICGTELKYFSHGYYAAVFVDKDRKKARKLFFRREARDKARCEKIFESEVNAYEIAKDNFKLSCYIPNFFGAHCENIVFDKDQNDVTSEFYSHLAYDMEFIQDEFIKINDANVDNREEIISLFRKQGINFMADCSVCAKNNQIIKVIDFGIQEFEAEWRDDL